MITVWGRTNSINVQKVMWTLGELGLEHERIDAGGKFGKLDTANYGAMNPNRRIPVLKDGETIVWESQACVRYLAALYGEETLWSVDPASRSLADRWMEWKITTLHPHMHILFWGLIRTPADQRNDAAIAQAAIDIQPLWSMVDEHLARHAWVAGDHFTMGDIPLGCAWWRYCHLGLEQPDCPRIQAWSDRLQSRPAYREHVMIEVT